MSKRGPKRTKIQRERDLVIVAEMYLAGENQYTIAERISENYPGSGVVQQQISYDIKKLIGRWQKSQLIAVDEAKARELERINWLEREARVAWELSKKDAETVVKETAGDGGKKRERVQVTTRGQVGNPAFLQRVDQCIEQRCKILGLYDQQPIQNLSIDMATLTTEQLEKIANGGDPVRVLADTGTS